MTGTGPGLVHLAGPLRVDRDGRALARAEIGSRKGRALLRLLAARRGDVLPRAGIAAGLRARTAGWAPPAAARRERGAAAASRGRRLRGCGGGGAVVGGCAGYRLGTVE